MKFSTLSVRLALLLLPSFFVSPVLAQNTRVAKKTVSKERAKDEAPKSETPKTEPAEKTSNPAFLIDSDLSILTLRLSHSLLGRFETTGKGLSGRIELIDGKLFAKSIEFNANSFESLITLRDDHIKNDYLEVSKFPKIFLLRAESILGTEKDLTKLAQPLKGTLTVKNTPLEIQGKAQSYIDDEILRGRFEFTGKISSFPIKKPNYKGVGVEDTFSILVELVAKPDFGDEDTSGYESAK